MVGRTLDYIDETGDDITLVVMSDHGFTSWRRSFHLNTWLVDSGYMELERRTKLPVADFWTGVNWRRTQAYGLGISGLYLNLRGREPRGVVAPGDRQELIEQLERDLLAAIDPVTGQPAVTRVYVRERDFKDRGHLEIGPDIIVGFAKGTRGSGSSALGGHACGVDRRQPRRLVRRPHHGSRDGAGRSVHQQAARPSGDVVAESGRDPPRRVWYRGVPRRQHAGHARARTRRIVD